MTAPDPESPSESDPVPLPPVMPDLDDCCGQGCDPCIFDIYEAKRQRYLKALRAWQQRQAAREEKGSGAAPESGPAAADGSRPSGAGDAPVMPAAPAAPGDEG